MHDWEWLLIGSGICYAFAGAVARKDRKRPTPRPTPPPVTRAPVVAPRIAIPPRIEIKRHIPTRAPSTRGTPEQAVTPKKSTVAPRKPRARTKEVHKPPKPSRLSLSTKDFKVFDSNGAQLGTVHSVWDVDRVGESKLVCITRYGNVNLGISVVPFAGATLNSLRRRIDLPFDYYFVCGGPDLRFCSDEVTSDLAIAVFRYYGIYRSDALRVERDVSRPSPTLPRQLAGRNSGTIYGRRTQVVFHDKFNLAKPWKGKACPVCGEFFVEGSVPDLYIAFLGSKQIDICSPCITTVWGYSGSETTDYEGVIEYVRTLAAVLERLPPRQVEIHKLLPSLTTDQRVRLFQARENGPSVRRVKEVCGSWLQALVTAGLLEGGVRRTSRGTQCLAVDGHVCWSLGEKTIDDRLHSLGVAHSREPRYPEGNFRGDFLVGHTIIEYAGLEGHADYDQTTSQKKLLCARHGIKIVVIRPSDVVELPRLDEKLRSAQDAVSA
jgi:hypothetical protein